jgi:hypothetical protein
MALQFMIKRFHGSPQATKGELYFACPHSLSSGLTCLTGLICLTGLSGLTGLTGSTRRTARAQGAAGMFESDHFDHFDKFDRFYQDTALTHRPVVNFLPIYAGSGPYRPYLLQGFGQCWLCMLTALVIRPIVPGTAPYWLHRGSAGHAC